MPSCQLSIAQLLRRAVLAAALVALSPANALAATPDLNAESAPEQQSTTNKDARDDVDVLYATATAALDADQPAKAREILERIVARRPEFAGAWLDLALASYRSGDIEAGLEHLEYLRSHFALPPVLSSQVDHWYKRWQQPDAKIIKQTQWQGELTLGLGSDTNVNSGLASNSLSITLPGGSVELPVDRASRPVADNFALFGLTAWGPAHALGQGSITPLVLMRGKRMQSQNEYSSFDMQAGAFYRQPAEDAGSWRLSGFVQQNHLDGKTLNNAIRLDAQRIYPWSACQISAGTDLEVRQARDDAEVGGSLYALSAGLSCPLPGDASLSSQLRIGHTRPRAGWPGGSKNGQELAFQYSRTLSGGRRIDLAWRTSWLNDKEGYSQLLENNAARRITRHSLSFSLRQPLTTTWDVLLNVEALRQQSNLELFRYNTQLFMISLARVF